MSEAYGIAFNSKGMDSTEPIEYDSSRRTITVDLSLPLEHAKIIELDGGTTWTRAAGAGSQEWEEVIWEFKHKMPFKPKVYSFYYVYDVPYDRPTAPLGSYFPDKLLAVTNSAGYGYEDYTTEVDKDYVRIVHRAGAINNIFSAFNGNGSRLKFRFRLLVTQLEDISIDA